MVVSMSAPLIARHLHPAASATCGLIWQIAAAPAAAVYDQKSAMLRLARLQLSLVISTLALAAV